ncbi:MAG: prepilin-type N-terminal cleavage/methylation domain-containing protein [Chthoniobacterales bacterium]|nr:prepilin-type N-terminal cleavage/methylation domain-containing protein [Chthoniobacterales bacterium]
MGYDPTGARKSLISLRGGWTLVEMLVLVCIVAILLALMMPAVSHMRKAAQNAKCLSNLRGLGTAALLYVAENDNYLPPVRMEPPAPAVNGLWYDHLHQYIGREPGRAGRMEPGQPQNNPWWCPSVVAPSRRYTYAINRICGFGGSGDPVRYVKMGQRFINKTGEILPLEGPLSKTAWFADGRSEYFMPVVGGLGNSIDWRHANSHANVLFMDGHVEGVKDPEFSTNASLFQEPKWATFFGQTP